MVKKIFALSAAVLAAGLISFASAAQAPAKAYAQQAQLLADQVSDDKQVLKYSRTFYDIFGTEATIALYDYFETEQSKNDAIEFVDGVYDTLRALEQELSVSIEGSDIYNFNAAPAGEKVEISQNTYKVLEYALEVYADTNGAYNAGVYYSVDLYGFAARTDNEKRPYDRDDYTTQLPDKKYVKAFQELSESFDDIALASQDGKYYVIKPQDVVKVEGDPTEYNLHIDLGGIGKGYAVDVVDDMLEEAGYTNSYFSFGSSSMAINGSATSEDGKWELTFRDPRGNLVEYYLTTRAANVSVSTSGDYEQYYEIGGKRYCHIIDPETGSPINNGIITATVIGGTAAEDDARTTALCCMTLKEAREYMNSEEVKQLGLKIAVVYQNFLGWMTVYTNMADGEYTLSLHNSLYSWVYLVIVVLVVVVAVAIYIIVRVVNKKRQLKNSQSETK